jgi:hypothetical protein
MFWGVSDRFITTRSCVGIFCDECTGSTPLDPKLMFWGISDRFITARKSMQNWPNWRHLRTSSQNDVTSESFTMNAPDLLRWTQNSCFGHFRPFRYCTKVDAKLAELVPLTHKFATRSCAGIFRNECIRSSPLDPKLMFWGVLDRFVTARKSMQNWSNWCY